MTYILTTSDGLSKEIKLRSVTKVDSLLESNGVFFKVKEIVILNPEEGRIEIRCNRLPENLKSWTGRTRD